MALTVEESASSWARLGGGELEQALQDGLLKCLDSRFLVDLLRSGAVGGGAGGVHLLQRMQDLPDAAFIGLDQLKQLGTYKTSTREPEERVHEWLPVAVLSHLWLGRAHPDPHGETLAVLVKALEKMEPLGVILDFSSLPQEPRTGEEEERFSAGLQKLGFFISHPHTLVLQATQFPAGYPSARSYDLPEGVVPRGPECRGWCFAEACLASLGGKTPPLLCDLSCLSEEVVGEGEGKGKCAAPPLSPALFREGLASKAFSEEARDRARAEQLFEAVFNHRVRDAESLVFAKLRWGPEEIHQFTQVIEVSQQLQYLSLAQNMVGGADGMASIAQVLEAHPTLRTLLLVECQIDDAGARVLGEALSVNTTLTTLNLFYNQITVEGAGFLAEALRVNKALTSLNLGDNALEDEGIRPLAEALKVNTTLTTLVLESNEIREEGTQSLAEAVRVNTALTTLNVRANYVGNEGVRYLAEALRENATLTALGLDNDDIGAEGAQLVAEALKSNTTLTKLNLADNEIQDAGAQSLAEALRVNSKLLELRVGGDDDYMGAEGRRALTEGASSSSCTVHFDII